MSGSLRAVPEVAGLGIRWLGPLIELGLDGHLGELEASAYGHLEDCGWQSELDAAKRVDGEVTSERAAAFARAARSLGAAGEDQGPEPDAEI